MRCPKIASTSPSAIARRLVHRARRRNHRLRQGGGAGGAIGGLRKSPMPAFLDAVRERMPGDASTRSYARLIRDDGTSILMNRRASGWAGDLCAENPTGCRSSRRGRQAVRRHRQWPAHGFSAPAIRHADLDSGFLITEDFGSAGVIEGDPPRPIVECYEAATDMLAELHRKALPKRRRWSRRVYTKFRLRYRCMAGRDRPDARMVSAGSRR